MSAAAHRISQDTPTELQAYACTGKTPFRAPNTAEKRAKAMRRRLDRPFSVYRCAFCRRWHIGSRGGD